VTEPPFTASREDRADRTVLRFGGELDATSTDAVRATIAAAMDQATGRWLVLDLADVSFLDSSTIGTVLWARDRSRKRNAAVSIVAPEGSRAARVLQLAGLRSVVPIVAAADDD
jgi:anti-anti-sigma factor